MGFEAPLKRVLEKLTGETQQVGVKEITVEELWSSGGEVYVRELAFWACVNLIANAVSKCEFKTFERGKEVKKRNYYRWNISPNLNQSGSVFIHKLISQLYRHNEALVIESSGQLLVADSFCRKPYALLDDVFSQVQVGDFSFSRTFLQSEVLYFHLGEKDMRKVTAGLYNAYSRLIDYTMQSYQKSRGTKGILKINSSRITSEEDRAKFDKLMNQDFRALFSADNAVLPLFDGYEFEPLSSKTYSNEGTRDIRAMVDDVLDFTARGFGLPPALLNGSVQDTDKAIDQALTFCLDPLCTMLAEEINRKTYGEEGFMAGDYLQIDTKAVKHVDLLSVSASVDKLISSGAFTINDIRDLVGEPKIPEPWADEHYMTKNYATIAEALVKQGGGETG